MTNETRRDFLARTGALVGFSPCVPAFLAGSLPSFFSPRASASDTSNAPDDNRVLVVVQLAGGNDGLNTLIPFRNDHYYRLRPRLAVEQKRIIPVTDDLGWHPDAAGFQSMIDDGTLCVLNGVGYPNPDRSHFVSTRIWETASPKGRQDQGWLGRYLDNQCCGAEPPPASQGVALTDETPLALRGDCFLPITCPKPTQFGGKQTQRMKRLMPRHADSGSADSPGNDSKASSNLDFLRRIALESIDTSSLIRRAASKAITGEAFPQHAFGQAMRDIARMIASDLPTKIYYAKATGFDTHANQANQHARLLRTTGTALHAFTKALKQTGHLDRTLVVVFSEFGRRVEENASGGTDHGKAGPVFVMGGATRAGVLGHYPALNRLDDGDLAYTIDFRQVYATVLNQWLRTPADDIMGQRWKSLPFLQKA